MRVVIVGAGLAGLVAARELHAAGVDVTVIDKGRSPGGRLATRRIGGATLDHGAQFFTTRSPAFTNRVEQWQRDGLVHTWNHGFDTDPADPAAGSSDGDGDGHSRYVGTAGMNSIAKHLAQGLDVRCSTMAFSIRRDGDSGVITVAIDDGTSLDADAVIITTPIPQALALLIDGGVDLDKTLFATDYDRTIGLLARLDRPVHLAPSGGIQHADDVFGFIGDNQSKGISAEPALTFHANATWSEENWDLGNESLIETLANAAQPWLGEAEIVESSLKKWRLATPRSIWPDPCWVTGDGSVILAGDAFAGPKVEGAHNSGMAAAHHLLR